MQESIKEKDVMFLEYIIKAMVEHSDDVRVTRKVDEQGVLLNLFVNPGDMGKVIGHGGKTGDAIRLLLRVVGMKNNARVSLKICEPEEAKSSDSKIDEVLDRMTG